MNQVKIDELRHLTKGSGNQFSSEELCHLKDEQTYQSRIQQRAARPDKHYGKACQQDVIQSGLR